MRPKSIATVVSLLRLRVASVICRSVDRTVISLMVRIRVVFPAANGPVTTIFTAVPDPRRRVRFAIFLQPPYAGDQAQNQALVDIGIALDGIGGQWGRRGHRSAACHR